MTEKKRKPKNTYWPKRLKTLRRKLDLSQAKVAEKIGISRATWISWEHGFRVPSASSQKLITLLENGTVK